MLPLTAAMPKALIPVAGRPFCDWQLLWLAEEGVEEVVMCVGHLGSLIEEHVRDGSEFGLEVRYVREGDDLRGTAGALRLAAEQGVLAESFAVLYGDSYLSLDLSSVERAYAASGKPALMTVLRNQGKWDRSNAVVNDGSVVRYEKGLTPPPSEMKYIDYGLTVLRRDVITELIAPGEKADLANTLSSLSRRGQLAAFEVTSPFYEVGSPTGLKDLERFLMTGQGRQ